MVKIGIVGCGVVGLSTALAVRNELPNAELVVHGHRSDRHVTSYGAAGIFRPEPNLFPDLLDSDRDPLLDELFYKWCLNGQQRFWHLAACTDPALSGVFYHPTFNLYNSEKPQMPFIHKLLRNVKEIDFDEIKSMGFNEEIVKSACFYTTCIIEPRYYMKYLLQELETGSSGSGLFHCHTESKNACEFESGEQLYSWAQQQKLDLVINCTGLGSSHLFKDSKMCPLRGHLVRVRAPWMKFGFFGPDDTYAYTGQNDVILGGYRELLPTTTSTLDTNDLVRFERNSTDLILEKIKRIWRSPLNQASICEEWTGLRPFRTFVRVESDQLKVHSDSNAIPLVHNYGHGSMGIALSWGTALEACKLTIDLLKRT